MRKMVAKLPSWGWHVRDAWRKEHRNGKEVVLDVEHSPGRWAIIEAKRIKVINESNQRVVKCLKNCFLNLPVRRQ